MKYRQTFHWSIPLNLFIQFIQFSISIAYKVAIWKCFILHHIVQGLKKYHWNKQNEWIIIRLSACIWW